MNIDFEEVENSKESKVVLYPGVLNYKSEEASLNLTSVLLNQFKELSFVQEAVSLAKETGIIVVDTLQEAFQRRSIIFCTPDQNLTNEMFGEKKNERIEAQRSLTVREAQNVFRQCEGNKAKTISVFTSNFFWDSIMKTIGLVTEEDDENSSLIYYLRFRYNRACDYIKKNLPSRDSKVITTILKAKDSLSEISSSLYSCGHPLFPVETDGMSEELLKPETVSFYQFSKKLQERPIHSSVSDQEIQKLFIRHLLLLSQG